MKKSICIITTFRSADEAYSLNRVVINQVKMFLHGGYPVTVVAAKGFIDSLKNKPVDQLTEGQLWYLKSDVTLKEISDVPVYNDNRVDDTFEKDVETLMVEFEELLKDVDVAITHDVVYQPAGLKHNAALRMLATTGKIKTRFLHWIHSATTPAIIKELRGGGQKFSDSFKLEFPNSFYIAFNEYSVPRIAGWFGCEESKIKYVPHPHDFCEYKHEMTQKIVNFSGMLDKDVVCMYPCRLDRGKQPHIVLETMAQVKKLGKSICLIIGDFHSTAGDKVDYRNQMKERAIDLGLNDKDIIFLSEFEMPEGQQYRYEMPHRVIQELFEFTNVFILPSRSETYSLVTQEAIAKKNFVILNQDFPPFRSIFGDAPLFRQYSSDMNANTGFDGATNTTLENADDYHRATAQYICYVMSQTRVMKTHNKIRQERNLDKVFKNYIEPLLYADPKNFNY